MKSLLIYHQVKPGVDCPDDKKPVHNKDMIVPDQVFGHLTVVQEIEQHVSSGGVSSRAFRFKCKCGSVIDRKLAPIREGRVVSCGCHNEEKRTKHGQSATPLYKVWTGIQQRCYNPKNSKFAIYGGKGVRVCQEWRSDPSAFVEWALQNGYKPGLTIDRVDGSKDYEPSNCRIADYETQNNNTSRNRFLEIFGESKTVADWAKDDRCAVGYEAFAARINRGWNPLEALTKQRSVAR